MALVEEAKERWQKETKKGKIQMAKWAGNKQKVKELENQRVIRGFFFFLCLMLFNVVVIIIVTQFFLFSNFSPLRSLFGNNVPSHFKIVYAQQIWAIDGLCEFVSRDC